MKKAIATVIITGILTGGFTYLNFAFIPSVAYKTKQALKTAQQEAQKRRELTDNIASSATNQQKMLAFMQRHNLKRITPKQLKSANTPERCYIAYKGIVYDVSKHPMWKGCKHNGYRGGIDATKLFPHPVSYLDSVKIVGVLSTYIDSLPPQERMKIMQQTMKPKTLPLYTYQEISKHSNYRSCWVIVDGYVYDVTKFISKHPGGSEILEGCGRDLSGLFSAGIHNQQGRDYLETFKIGKVKNYKPPKYRYYDD